MKIKLRQQSGQGVILLSLAIGLVIIPLLGLFAFEVARYQHGVMQLENNCDSAALAGAAMLVTSAYQNPNERSLRWADVETAAGNALKSTFPATAAQLQDVLGSDMKTAVNVGTGNTPKLGTIVGHCEYTVEPVDPSNFNTVAIAATTAKAVRVRALFTTIPAFARYLGTLSLVPVSAKATAGIPVLDLVVCFDVSGSMDDSTRVSMVMRQWQIPAAQQQQLAQQYNAYSIAAANFNATWANAANCSNLSVLFDYNYQKGIVTGLWNSYWQARGTAGQTYGKIDYSEVMTGTLAECLFKPPLAAEGWPANVQFPQQLNLIDKLYGTPPANPNLQIFNYPERYTQETGLSFRGAAAAPAVEEPSNYDNQCADPIQNGLYGDFTDLIVKCDGGINSNTQSANQRPQQPLFFPQSANPMWPPTTSNSVHPAPFTYVKKRPPYQGHSYPFNGMGYLVEAQRGNLEPQNFNKQLFAQNIAAGELPAFPLEGYQAAYFEMASYYSQPIASTIDAVESFYQALSSVGADVNFGLTAFETEVAVTPGGTTSTALADIADTVPPINNGANANASKRPLFCWPLSPMVQPDQTMLQDPYGGGSMTFDDILESRLIPLRSTNIPLALQTALNMLQNSPRRAFARQAILLITDGVATVTLNGTTSPTGINSAASQDSRTEADKANKAGVPIFCVGVAQNPSVLALQEPFLGDNQTSPNMGLAARSGNGARYFQITYNDLTTTGNAQKQQTNKVAETLQQVVRNFVQLME